MNECSVLLAGVEYLCYLDTNPLRAIFSAGLPGGGANKSLILTLPAVPIPTTTAPNILKVQNKGEEIQLQMPGGGAPKHQTGALS